MRKVIKGKMYDTDTATLVAERRSGYPSDFDYFTETLYRKRTGEYFIHGHGNAASPYAHQAEMNRWESGESIAPMSYEDARSWMEKHAEADEYEAEFGIADEGLEHDLHVIISEPAWQAISRKAAADGTSIRTIIERMASEL